MKEWPSIELKDIGSISEAEQNSRVHSPEQIEQIAASMEKFGFTIPLLVDEGGVLIAGHARFRAAKKLGLEQVPAMIAVGWTEAEKEAYQIADNQLALNSEWDTDILEAQLKRLVAAGFDMDVLALDLEPFDLGEAFNPNLAPSVDTSQVTADDMTKAQRQQDERFQNQKPVETYEVVCPHCKEAFDVQL